MANVKARWIDGEMFVGVDSHGHTLVTGSWPGQDPEWAALKPSDLLLLGLIACSGYDVVTILRKQREDLTRLIISADAKQMEEPPYAFTHIHITYHFGGHELDEAKVARAIQLSEEKYCSVAATVRGVAEITSEYRIELAE